MEKNQIQQLELRIATKVLVYGSQDNWERFLFVVTRCCSCFHIKIERMVDLNSYYKYVLKSFFRTNLLNIEKWSCIFRNTN